MERRGSPQRDLFNDNFDDLEQTPKPAAPEKKENIQSYEDKDEPTPKDKASELKYVDKDSRTKLFFVIVGSVLTVLALIIINANATKEQKGKPVTLPETTVTTSVPVTVVEEETVVDMIELPPDLSFYGTWDIFGNGAYILTLNAQGDFTITITNEYDQIKKMVYTGKATVYCGSKATNATQTSNNEVISRFAIEPKRYNPDNYYYVKCQATEQQVNDGDKEKVDAVVFEKQLYLFSDENGSLHAEYYEEDSEVALKEIYFVRGEE